MTDENEIREDELVDFDLLDGEPEPEEAPAPEAAQSPAPDDADEDLRALERVRSKYPHLFAAPRAEEKPEPPKGDQPDGLKVDWSDPDGIEKAIRNAAVAAQKATTENLKPLLVEQATTDALNRVGVDAPEVRQEVRRMLDALPAEQLPNLIRGGLHELVAKAAVGDAALKGRFAPKAAPRAEPVGGAQRMALTRDEHQALSGYEQAFGKLSAEERRRFIKEYRGGE